jgi:hypothetical protein
MAINLFKRKKEYGLPTNAQNMLSNVGSPSNYKAPVPQTTLRNTQNTGRYNPVFNTGTSRLTTPTNTNNNLSRSGITYQPLEAPKSLSELLAGNAKTSRMDFSINAPQTQANAQPQAQAQGNDFSIEQAGQQSGSQDAIGRMMGDRDAQYNLLKSQNELDTKASQEAIARAEARKGEISGLNKEYIDNLRAANAGAVEQSKLEEGQDLRSEMEAKRELDAQLNQKFANQGTAGSTGYFGQSGLQSRADQAFLDSQANTQASGRNDRNTLYANLKNKEIEAQSEINTMISQYDDVIANLEYSLAGKPLELQQAKMELDNALYSAVGEIQAQLAEEQALFDEEVAKTESGNAVKRGMVSDIDELLGQNLDKITGVFGTRLSNVPGTQRAATRSTLDKVLNNLTLENISKLKGTGAISDREMLILQQAATDISANLPADVLRARLEKLRNELALEGGTGQQESYNGFTIEEL